MSRHAPTIILFCALATAFFWLCVDNSYPTLKSLRTSLAAQQERNGALRAKVNDLKREVNGIQHDDRILEKAARNELGMTAPGELIYIFDSAPKKL